MTTTSQAQSASVDTKPLATPAVSEDWLAVGIAFVIIALVLTGIRLALPSFTWTTAGELSGAVLGPQNLQRSLIAGAALGVFAAAGAWLAHVPLARFIAGF